MKIKRILTLEKNSNGKWTNHCYCILYPTHGTPTLISPADANDLVSKGIAKNTTIDTRQNKLEGIADRFEDLPIRASKEAL